LIYLVKSFIDAQDFQFRCKQEFESMYFEENRKEFPHFKNVVQNENEQEKVVARESLTKKEGQKTLVWVKSSILMLIGGVGLLWFVVMLIAQPDFEGIIAGWAIIGGVYLIFKIFYKV